MRSSQSNDKKQHLRFPWWGSILLAILIYTSMNYLLPSLTTTNQSLSVFFEIAPDLAPIPTILFLLLGAKQLYDGVEPTPEPPVEKDEQ